MTITPATTTEYLKFTAYLNGKSIATSTAYNLAITYTTATGAITSISGTVGGATVTGPGTTNVVIMSNGSTVTIKPDNKFSSSSPYIDTSGIEFSAGGTTYAIQYTSEGGYETYDSQNEFAGVKSVTVSMTCYTRGTHISTDRGDCPIEALQIGDLVLTASGALRPIRWIGHSAHDQRFAAHPNIAPILIRAGALDDGVPARDLYVSPQHAMLLDGVLVPAKCLINNTTIVQPKPTSTVAYFHIELESHDVILAEGAPSETYVNDDNRAMFENADEYTALYPSDPAPPARYCAERIEYGPVLDAIRDRLAARAAATELTQPMTHVVTLSNGAFTRAVIPAGVTAVHLLCGRARPAGEGRMLGALLQEIRLDDVAIDLADERLTHGFHEVEQHGAQYVRWTDGHGIVQLSASRFARVLEVRVVTQIGLALAA